jgi:hypothetical protein
VERVEGLRGSEGGDDAKQKDGHTS